MYPTEFIQDNVTQLVSVQGIKAIVLGGSWAAGTQEPDSDIDLGLYYSADMPLDITHIRQIARELNDDPTIYITGLSEWGR